MFTMLFVTDSSIKFGLELNMNYKIMLHYGMKYSSTNLINYKLTRTTSRFLYFYPRKTVPKSPPIITFIIKIFVHFVICNL